MPSLAATLLLATAAATLAPRARTGFLALVASSPFLLLYAAEARPYAVLALADFAVFLLAVRGPERPARFVAIAALAALALYTHYLSLVFISALLLCLLLQRRVRSAAALLAGSLLFLPWVPVLADQPKAATAWMREPPLFSAAGFLSALGGAGRIPLPFGRPLPPALFWAAAAAALTLVVAIALAAKREREVRFALLVVGLTLTGLVMVSFWRPIAFAGRSEMAVLPIWLWAAARAAAENRLARFAAAAASAVGVTACVLLMAASPRGDSLAVRAATLVARTARAGDVVFADTDFYLPARLALDRGEIAAWVESLPADLAEHPGWFAPRWPTESDYRRLESALERVAPTGRAFFLLRPLDRTRALGQILDARGTLRPWIDHGALLFTVWSPGKTAR